MGLTTKLMTSLIQSLTTDELKEFMSPEQRQVLLAPELNNDYIIENINRQFCDESDGWDDLFQKLCSLLSSAREDLYAEHISIEEFCNNHCTCDILDHIDTNDSDTIAQYLTDDKSVQSVIFDVLGYYITDIVDACVNEFDTSCVLEELDEDDIRDYALSDIDALGSSLTGTQRMELAPLLFHAMDYPEMESVLKEFVNDLSINDMEDFQSVLVKVIKHCRNREGSTLWVLEHLRVSEYPDALQALANFIIHKVTEPETL